MCVSTKPLCMVAQPQLLHMWPTVMHPTEIHKERRDVFLMVVRLDLVHTEQALFNVNKNNHDEKSEANVREKERKRERERKREKERERERERPQGIEMENKEQQH